MIMAQAIFIELFCFEECDIVDDFYNDDFRSGPVILIKK